MRNNYFYAIAIMLLKQLVYSVYYFAYILIETQDYLDRVY